MYKEKQKLTFAWQNDFNLKLNCLNNLSWFKWGHQYLMDYFIYRIK